MEFGVVSGAAIMGMVCTLIISVGLPIGLLIFAKIKYKASIATFFIGAGTFILFAMLLEQCLHTGVIALLGGADKLTANIWLYALYGGTAAAVFEETGRWIAIKFFLKLPSLSLWQHRLIPSQKCLRLLSRCLRWRSL